MGGDDGDGGDFIMVQMMTRLLMMKTMTQSTSGTLNLN
jgi:hypothetical protein